MQPGAPDVTDLEVRVRVLIVDDQAPYRLAARSVVQCTAGFELVGEAESGDDGVVAVAELAPDLVLMDINMPGVDGIEATRRITERPGAPIVVLMSTYAADALPAAAREVGAARYVHKEDLGPDVLRDVWRDARAADEGPRPSPTG